MPRRKKETQVPIGKKIRRARLAKKITYDILANETGFSIEYLKEIETGKVTPPVERFFRSQGRSKSTPEHCCGKMNPE